MLRFIFITLLSFVGFFSTQASASTDPVVAVQLFEWPWADIARECELYLGPKGFTAVQTSPPQEHLASANDPWWERYQVVSYKISSRSGDEKAFSEMIRRCHKAGVKVYTDAVINHMTGVDGGQGFAGTAFTHYDYPGIYTTQDFHHCGTEQDDIKDFSNLFQLQNCELVNLADLATEKASVQEKIAGYMNHLLDLGVDGFRIDAAKHIPAKDIGAILARLKKTPYVFQELIISPGEPLKYSDYTGNGAVTAYGYPYFLASVFKKKNIKELQKIESLLPASDDAVVFLNNHDIEREPDQDPLINFKKDARIFSLAQVFMMTWPYGYPYILSGYNFTNRDDGPPLDGQRKTLAVLDTKGDCKAPWTCAHRDSQLEDLIRFRKKAAASFFVANQWDNGKDQMAYSRGADGFVVINYSENDLSRSFQTSLEPGTYCNELDSTVCTYVVDANKKLKTTVLSMTALVLQKKSAFR